VRFVHDPGGTNLRKGLRAAIIVPVVYGATGAAVGSTAALYAAFASFASLVFADFQGTARRKVEGYATLAVIGAVLVLVGSASAGRAAVAVAAIATVTFVIRFVGCLGGYAIAAGTTLMLAFALSVMTRPVVELDQRVGGWVLGCIVAGLGALVAPLHRPPVARDRLAAQSRALAARLRALAEDADLPDLDITLARQVREDLARAPGRPLVATVGQTALTGLLDAIGRATLILEHMSPGPSPFDDVERRLARTAASTFDAAAEALAGGPPADLVPARDALVEHRDAVVAGLRGDDPAARRSIEDGAVRATRLRLVTSLAAVAAADASIWAGHRPPDTIQLDVEVEVPKSGTAAFLARARRTLGFHLRWQSTRFRNSLRAAAALALSLAVARAVDFDHGFWVVLGTLMVLRSGVNDTAVTAVQALRGTVIGFALAAPIAFAANGQDGLLWVLLPAATFLAAWAPGAVGLGSGQAAFTVFVVVLFNLAEPSGAQTAVLRLETVATGIAVAVVAGFVFWPRGPEGSLAPMAARLYRASAATVRAVSAEVLGLSGGPEGLRRARTDLIATREELEETLQELTNDRRASVLLADRVAMMTPPALVISGDWTRRNFGLGPTAPDEGRRPPVALEARAFETEAGFTAVASWLDDASAPTRPLPRPEGEPPPSDGVDPEDYLRMIWLWAWLSTLERSLAHTSDATVAAVRSLPTQWWR
jgi:uncharacterized membrane protein YccC